MSEPGFASLGPTLLARKGGAKPAMRPQLPPLVQDEAELAAIAEEQLEDLGWNDMGGDDAVGGEGGADIVPINGSVMADDYADAAGPIVRRQQRRLEERVLADAVMTGPEDREPEYDEADQDDEDDADRYAVAYGDSEEESEADEDDGDYAAFAPQPPVAPAPVVRAPLSPRRLPAVKQPRRAAFTLRLDAERHLKLRLAATMQGVSAQALVTEALDALLAEFDELDVIANHLKRH
jgi:hypothetical protein